MVLLRNWLNNILQSMHNHEISDFKFNYVKDGAS